MVLVLKTVSLSLAASCLDLMLVLVVLGNAGLFSCNGDMGVAVYMLLHLISILSNDNLLASLKTTVFDLMNDDVYTKAIAIGSQMMVAPASEHVLCRYAHAYVVAYTDQGERVVIRNNLTLSWTGVREVKRLFCGGPLILPMLVGGREGILTEGNPVPSENQGPGTSWSPL
ncbi:hypothetical protein QQP08_024893 [Theobroma cacao]|nr:hypothetical protein QQP08_024893 [Theobroma cacao]